MKCVEIDKLALLRHSGEASAREIAELEEHLLSCPECRAKVEQIEETLRIYQQHKIPQSPALPAGLRSRILSEVGNPKRKNARKMLSLRIPMSAAALAVAASVLFVFLIVMPGQVNKNSGAIYGTHSYIFEDLKSQDLVSKVDDNIETIDSYMTLIGEPNFVQDESIIAEETDSFDYMINILSDFAEELNEIESVWDTEQTT